MSSQDTLKIVIVGHVDHGKSTLIGRLFYDTGSIPEARYREIEATCRRQGRPFEFAYLMDALEEERDQNVTIDTAQTFFRTDKRPYVIIDAPGHKEFLKNMITGAASADAAILLLDGVEGVREQTRRHAYLLSLLGIRQVIVAVNKLDLVGYDRGAFQRAENEIRTFLHSLGIVPAYVIPISARDGENIARSLGHTPWYDGPPVLRALDTFATVRAEEGLPLRLPIQDVYKWEGRRLYVGRVETGSVRAGDEVVFVPSGRRARVRSVEAWRRPDLGRARAGQCVGLTFDEELFVERGEVLARADAPPVACREVRASLVWLSNRPFERGRTYVLKLATAEVQATCVDIEERLDSASLEVTERHAPRVFTTEAANVLFELKRPLAADLYSENDRLGRFVVEDGTIIGGGGIIRQVEAVEGSAAAQVIHLDRKFATEPDGNLVDLSRERGAVEFEVTPHFLDTLRRGNRVLFRLRGPRQLESVALLAYEHHLSFTFTREGDRVSVVLFKKGAAPPVEAADAVGL
ncbi:MAG: GTP-binding protein [Deferrisomatales bacterium]